MKKIIYTSSILLMCIIAFYVLFSSKQNSATGFKRRIVQPKLEILNTYTFPDKKFSFLWEPLNDIWFLDHQNPMVLLKTQYSLQQPKPIQFTPSDGFKLGSKSMYFDRLDSIMYATNKLGDLSVWSNHYAKNYNLSPLIFDAVKGFSQNSVVVRNFSIDQGQRQTELSKVRLSAEAKTERKFILPKQIDGFFSTDGKIHYDKKHSRIFYLFFHRGEFLCLDTNLNLVYNAKTIDTVRSAKIKFGAYKDKFVNGILIKSRNLIAPLETVNRSITTDEDYVYIHSYLRSDNESKSTYLKNESIDIYLLKNGKYVHSFYLPRYKNTRLRDFKVRGEYIFAIYGNHVLSYHSR
ncbi:hypothetical protein [Pedobacter psychroterrae]|uniref:Uncharacterized protein n=1 Tax=Pedobacter psychroterrae TaxID=2530453 RepID=A0A4R0NPS1_9SPHI|nr:hypothetical protein [Pedobacter psychroterrae]TCD01235.1 hypothetical protein EZ437_10790 [Pedobacter psychroterrae]